MILFNCEREKIGDKIIKKTINRTLNMYPRLNYFVILAGLYFSFQHYYSTHCRN